MKTILRKKAVESHQWWNTAQSILQLGTLTGLLSLLGWLLAGTLGIAFATGTVLFTLWFLPRLSPAILMRWHQGRLLRTEELPWLHQIQKDLANRAGFVRSPALYYVPSSALNAFAVGNRQEGGIAVTDGLLRTLSYREVRAVLAHEMTHLQHNDVSVMLLSSIVGRLIQWLAWSGIALILFSLPLSWLYEKPGPWLWLLLMIVAPWLSLLLQAGLSRTREFQADLGAARLTDDPQALIQALAKIDSGSSAPVHPSETTLLQSHPATSERIARLASISQTVLEPRDFQWWNFNRPSYLSWTNRRYRWQ
ncbi:MAG: zinc metalloprotease HtpX [SAR324 cluster bacterium]|nr:zinc metalloprotease HtpX [SAR324 cluster bacterium]